MFVEHRTTEFGMEHTKIPGDGVVTVDSVVRHLGAACLDDQKGHREFALLHEHLTGCRGERSQLCRQRHKGLGRTAGEDSQRGKFVGADICQAGHVTRLRRLRRDEQGNEATRRRRKPGRSRRP